MEHADELLSLSEQISALRKQTKVLQETFNDRSSRITEYMEANGIGEMIHKGHTFHLKQFVKKDRITRENKIAHVSSVLNDRDMLFDGSFIDEILKFNSNLNHHDVTKLLIKNK